MLSRVLQKSLLLIICVLSFRALRISIFSNRVADIRIHGFPWRKGFIYWALIPTMFHILAWNYQLLRYTISFSHFFNSKSWTLFVFTIFQWLSQACRWLQLFNRALRVFQSANMWRCFTRLLGTQLHFNLLICTFSDFLTFFQNRLDHRSVLHWTFISPYCILRRSPTLTAFVGNVSIISYKFVILAIICGII